MKRSPLELVRNPPSPPGPFCNQATDTINASRVKLDKLHVLQRQSGTQYHAAAVPRAAVCGRCRKIGTSITTRLPARQSLPRTGAILLFRDPRPSPPCTPRLPMIRSSAKYSMKNSRLVLQRLLVQGMQDCMPGAVRRRAGTLCLSFPEPCCHTPTKARW